MRLSVFFTRSARVAALLVVGLSMQLGMKASPARAADDDLPQRADAALRKATDYFLNELSAEGGYMWRYSEDLERREGEGWGGRNTVWIQPPGTPTVGMLYLEAYQGTGDDYYLEAARRAGQCLVKGQLHSGGWTYRIEFDPEPRKRAAYRVEGEPENPKADNLTVLDDDNTQSALRFMMRLDKALDFQDEQIHEATLYALDRLVAAQYPNGAWPQRFTGPPDAEKHPVLPASYPADWSRIFPSVTYNSFYTFNDNAMGDTVEVMFEAADTYNDSRFEQAARRCGDFLLLSRMPEPQPAWAQQYDPEMHPAWARKFEPPSITGGESQSNLLTLLDIYCHTGDPKYLEPIPRTVEYLRTCLRADGRMPRFLELHTNRALYFTQEYALTYSDADLPTHYAFITTASQLERAARDYEKYRNFTPEQLEWVVHPARRIKPPTSDQVKAAEEVIAALDEQGRWLEPASLNEFENKPGERMISTSTFINRARALIGYIESARMEAAGK